MDEDDEDFVRPRGAKAKIKAAKGKGKFAKSSSAKKPRKTAKSERYVPRLRWP
jgi:hypothetical protein